jgi:hypothetical protein
MPKIILACIATIFIVFKSNSQSLGNISRAKDSTNKKAAPTGDKKIEKLEDIQIPEALIERIRKMKYTEIEQMTEEYQENVRKKLKDDDAEEEYIFFVKLKFLYDHVIGFSKYISRTDPKISKEKKIIDVPIEWCGQIDSTKENVCVESIDDIYRFTRDSIKTSNWVQKVEKALIGNVKQGEAFGKPINTKSKGKKNTASPTTNNEKEAMPKKEESKDNKKEKKTDAPKPSKKEKNKKPTGFGTEDE